METDLSWAQVVGRKWDLVCCWEEKWEALQYKPKIIPYMKQKVEVKQESCERKREELVVQSLLGGGVRGAGREGTY